MQSAPDQAVELSMWAHANLWYGLLLLQEAATTIIGEACLQLPAVLCLNQLGYTLTQAHQPGQSTLMEITASE
jgi:hypothetical protein